MSVIPERVLQRTIVRGIRNLRQNPRLMAALFGHLSTPEFESIVDFITNTHPTMHINYPRAELSPPALILSLQTESEDISFLSDYMGTSPHYGMPDAQFQFDGAPNASSITTLSGLTPKLIDGIKVVSMSGSRITVEADSNWLSFVQDPSVPLPALVNVVAGTGAGQQALMCKRGSNTLDIEGTFVVQLDSTSILEIREASTTTLKEGEPSRQFSADVRLERSGEYFSTTYQLDVVAGSQEQVIYLYSIVKSIFYLTKRTELEPQGIINLHLSGTDFSPRSDFLPDELFHRALIMTFTQPFSIYTEVVDPSNFSFSLDAGDPISQEEVEAFSQVIEI